MSLNNFGSEKRPVSDCGLWGKTKADWREIFTISDYLKVEQREICLR
jgi:hypothetical protein